MKSDAPTKCPKRCKDNTEIVNKRSITEITLNAKPSEELDVANCNAGDTLSREQSELQEITSYNSRTRILFWMGRNGGPQWLY